VLRSPSWRELWLKYLWKISPLVPCLRIPIIATLNSRPSSKLNNDYSFEAVEYVLNQSQVIDTRPPGARPNYTDISNVEKYVMPEEEYAKKTDSVLAWKKAQKLGRFNPDAPALEEAKIAAFAEEARSRGIEVGKRCRVGGDDARRGEVMYVGEVDEIPGGLGTWIGVQLDEPMGKNDGSIGKTRYWGEPSELKRGVFVRPERVEIGEWPVLNDFDEDMEEI
jgi:tubulin-specific chaperone B